MSTPTQSIEELATQEYRYGFVTDVEAEALPKGLNEDIVRVISQKKGEPEWMLEWRLKAFRAWQEMTEPTWPNVDYPPVDFQDIIYYSAPKPKKLLSSLDEVDPEVRATFEKLGIPLEEQKALAGVAVDAVFDSVSVATTFKDKLKDLGIIFCSFSEAVREHPELVRKYIGSVVPYTDNFFAALNSAVFSDGSFCYVPKGVRCPMELSTYFRINAKDTGQFERTLIVADEGAYVSYLEGCTAPMRDENQLHAAVVELVALDNATIKYSTVQNWYPGDKEGMGGIYNFVTKRGKAMTNAKITWTQVETGSAITWKYPSCILQGDNSVGEFYSVAVTNNLQQADTGTKMVHLGQEHPQHHRLEGHLGRQGPEHLPRPGQDRARAPRTRATTRSATRCSSATVRRPHLPVHRGEEHLVHGGARGVDVEDRRGPDLLPAAARARDRGRREHDRQRLLQGSLPRAADGVRGGGAEAARRQPRRQRRLRTLVSLQPLQPGSNPQCSRSRTSTRASKTRTSSGASTSRSSRARCTPSWAPTAPARARWPASSPAPDYEVTEGEVLYEGKDLLELDPEERAREGVFLAFQYPVEIPGVNNTYFLKAALNAIRKHRGLAELDAMEFLTLVRAEGQAARDGRDAAEPAGQRGLLGRREEAQRDLPDGGARADARHPRRDRLRPRHRRAAHRRRRRQRAAQPRAQPSSS